MTENYQHYISIFVSRIRTWTFHTVRGTAVPSAANQADQNYQVRVVQMSSLITTNSTRQLIPIKATGISKNERTIEMSVGQGLIVAK